MPKLPKMPEIPEEERTDVVVQLLEVVRYQMEMIQTLRDEIASLKGNKPKPKIKPGKMENGKKDNKEKKSSESKRPGSDKRSKTKELRIDEKIIIPAENLHEGSKFKGYKNFTVQGIIIKSHNILYSLERWRTPNGSYVEGKLPESLSGHYSPELISFILYQYYQCYVTQPLLLEELREFGIEISSGQLNRILVEGNENFNNEKDAVLSTGLEISSYINVDDTGARHKGKNGYSTHIGNDFFAWFACTESKSRINFLSLLRAGNNEYHITEKALSYIRKQKLPLRQLKLLEGGKEKVFESEQQWNNYLQSIGITRKQHIRVATEGALIGTILENDFNPEMVILSDDAGQFNVFHHALCWVHAERTINKIVPFSQKHRDALELSRKKIWEFYFDLKAYKKNPTKQQKSELEMRFDEVFNGDTCFIMLNIALKRLYKNKKELLLVLERTEVPLHNNASESDIREYVKRRKISGSTRSDAGRRSRDTFISLKKTCRKLGVSFWEYLIDRTSRKNTISNLENLMRQRAFDSTY